MAAVTSDQIAAAASVEGIPVDWMVRILGVENPSLSASALSPTSVQGLAQITHATWNTINPGQAYSTDPVAQLLTEAKLLAKYYQAYGGNLALAAAAYNGGPGVAAAAEQLINAGVPESQAIATAAATTKDGGKTVSQAKVNEITSYVAKVTGMPAATANALTDSIQTPAQSDTQAGTSADDTNAPTAVPIAGMAYSAAQSQTLLAAISPPLVITTNTQQPSWEDDPNILQVNNATSPVQDPVTFSMFFDQAGSALPFSLSLNASIHGYKLQEKHINTNEPTRTGRLITLWGMMPDTISAEGSTGVFMNQLGISDMLSLSTLPNVVQQEIGRGYSTTIDANGVLTIQGDNTNLTLSAGSMRMAAKDAFVELLALFKCNGSVWYQYQNYTGYTTQLQQQAPDAWSPQTGSSVFQNASRRNDVMSRGSVVMYFRGGAYYGYFNNLSWTMSASKPFEWDFTFTFKVESTTLNLSVPGS